MFLTWVACVVVATFLYVHVYNFIASWPAQTFPQPSKLRCPECGGKYQPGVALYPHQPPYVDPPRKSPRRPPRGPGAWKVTCATCGLHVVYGRWSRILRTFRELPAGW